MQDEVKLINGSIFITVQDKRTQYQNRQLALSRLTSTLQELLKPPQKKEKKPFRLAHHTRKELSQRKNEVK